MFLFSLLDLLYFTPPAMRNKQHKNIRCKDDRLADTTKPLASIPFFCLVGQGAGMMVAMAASTFRRTFFVLVFLFFFLIVVVAKRSSKPNNLFYYNLIGFLQQQNSSSFYIVILWIHLRQLPLYSSTCSRRLVTAIKKNVMHIPSFT